ncbi:acyltransferase [Suillus ampliporus]|nr:acyltransferase [Suillus ampliporus]
MQLMIVYRFLRKISDWTMSGFYSEVCVTGAENIPQDGPVIIAATHHNEIVDIAALSATIPYRRRVCYWAKSSLFKNPISGAMLTSSGSIPVYRNPNSSSSSSLPPNNNGSASQADLFRHTSAALVAGEVIGVFPEGTSYTEPGIVQVKDGAAWAAVEYVKVMNLSGKEGKELVIIPAAIVYTDKSKYQSRICVRYGKPVVVSEYAARLDLESAESTRSVVKEITAAIESELKHLTVNAPDWKTLHAACAARKMFWKNEDRIPLDKFVDITQRFVKTLSPKNEAMEIRQAILNRYLALLHFTGTSHSALEDLYPFVEHDKDFPMRPFLWPSRSRAGATFLLQLCITMFHPRALLFLPVFLVHVPGYITGWFAARMLTVPNEEETKAQFKAIFGGLGFAVSYGLLTRACVKLAMNFTSPVHSSIGSGGLAAFTEKVLQSFSTLCDSLAARHGSLKSTLSILVVAVGMTRSLWKWHNALVYVNYMQWKRFMTSFRVVTGLLLPPSFDLQADQLPAYSTPPLPAENPYIKRYTVEDPPRSSSALIGDAGHTVIQSSLRNADHVGPGAHGPSIPARKLIRHLFLARSAAYRALRSSDERR